MANPLIRGKYTRVLMEGWVGVEEGVYSYTVYSSHCRYVPPLLWGKNGHLHTFVFSKFSPKVECKAKKSQHSVKLEDNSTVIFDIFEPCSDGVSRV
jgi:hypothetical protein